MVDLYSAAAMRLSCPIMSDAANANILLHWHCAAPGLTSPLSAICECFVPQNNFNENSTFYNFSRAQHSSKNVRRVQFPLTLTLRRGAAGTLVAVNIFTVISFLEIAPASKYDDGPYILPEKPWTLSD